MIRRARDTRTTHSRSTPWVPRRHSRRPNAGVYVTNDRRPTQVLTNAIADQDLQPRTYQRAIVTRSSSREMHRWLSREQLSDHCPSAWPSDFAPL
jgi:hypothetical protein